MLTFILKYPTMVNCYICGAENANMPLAIKQSFTAHSRCKSIESDKLCERCYDCIEGKYKQCWYKKEDGKISKLWGRGWSWLVSDKESYPKFKEGKDGLLDVYDLPTRALIKKWIVNPPVPPFTICLAVSGQKHTYPFSQVSYSKDLIPILFEETLIYWKASDKKYLDAFEQLMAMGFSKTEIVTGEYNSKKMSKIDIETYLLLDNQIANIRNTPIFLLLEYIAQKL